MTAFMDSNIVQRQIGDLAIMTGRENYSRWMGKLSRLQLQRQLRLRM